MLVDELEEFRLGASNRSRAGDGRPEGLAAPSVIEGVVETAASGGIRSIGGEEGERAEDRPASSMRSEADGPGSVRSRLVERIGLRGMTLERITLEPGARDREIVGDTAEERFLYVIRGGGSAGDLPPRVRVDGVDRGRRPASLLAGDDGLEVLVAGADTAAEP